MARQKKFKESKRFTCRFSMKDFESIKKRANKKEVDVSDIVRDAVRFYLFEK